MKRVFVVDDTGQSKPINSIHCKDEDKELQTLLLNNYDLLAGEQISPNQPRRWLLIKREMPIPDQKSGATRWSVDFFFVDQVSGVRAFETQSRDLLMDTPGLD